VVDALRQIRSTQKVIDEHMVSLGDITNIARGSISYLVPRSTFRYRVDDKVLPQLSLAGSIGCFTCSREFGEIVAV